MGHPTLRIKVTTKDQNELSRLLSGGVQPVRVVMRAMALLQFAQGVSAPRMTEVVPLTAQAIRKIGHRYRQQGLARALYEKQRPGTAELLDGPNLAGSGADVIGSWEDRQMSPLVALEELFQKRHFDQEIVALCVRWYLSFQFSVRDLAALMGEHPLPIAHTTILRWVQHYTPEFEKRGQRYARPVAGSWRMEET